MLNEFIEKIEIYEAEKIDGNRTQRVDIHFNFIGNVLLPVDFVTTYEKEEEQRFIAEQAEKMVKSKELLKIKVSPSHKNGQCFAPESERNHRITHDS